MQRVYITNMSNMSWGSRIMAVLGVALGLALAAAFVVLSLGIALLLLPVVAVFAVIGWWRWRKMAAQFAAAQAEQGKQQDQRADGFRVIETDYEILGPDGRPR